MAKLAAELPDELIWELARLEKNTRGMMNEMLKESAKMVRDKISKNSKKVFKNTSSIEKGLKVTKLYDTKSDDARNIKIAYYDYLSKDGTVTKVRVSKDQKPIPLIALAREYGTSKGEAEKPFIRPAFEGGDIEDVMKKVQNKYLPKE